MRGQVKFKQGKLAARRRRRAFYVCLYWLAAAGLFLSALSYISGLQALAIQSITTSGYRRLAPAVVESIVRSDLAGTYLSLFSRGNFLLYPGRQIRHDVLALPLVKSASVWRNSVRTLAISVTERETAALWCTGELGQAAQCYSLDDQGFIFASLDAEGAPKGDFIYRGALNSGQAASDPIGQSILTPKDFQKIRFFMTELAGLSVEPVEAELSASSTYMTVALAQGGRLVINAADDLSLILDNIATIIADRSVTPSLPVFLKNLDYMKLDVGNKVVYKLKVK